MLARRVAVAVVVSGVLSVGCGGSRPPDSVGPVGVEQPGLVEGSAVQGSSSSSLAEGPASDGASQEAAEAAALMVVASMGDVVRAGFISRRELIESWCTVGFGPRFAAETGRVIDSMLVELGSRGVDTGPLRVVEQPITVSSTMTEASVVVRVWSVLVIAAPGAGPARQLWRTVTVTMVASDGRWLVDGWESAFGPTPIGPAEAQIDTAEDVAVVLDWERTVDYTERAREG
jgi:hypothetical protein